MDSGKPIYQQAVAAALWWDYNADDLPSDDAVKRAVILDRLLKVADAGVQESALRAVGTMMKKSRAAALELLMKADFGASTQAAEELFGSLRPEDIAAFSADQIETLASKLLPISELDYWSVEFLRNASRSFGGLVLDIFVKRIELPEALNATVASKWQPVPYASSLLPHIELFFDEFKPSVTQMLSVLERAALSRGMARFWFAELYANIASRQSVAFDAVRLWCEDGTRDKVLTSADMLHRVEPESLFVNSDIVVSLIETSGRLGQDVERQVSSLFFGALISGLRSGVPFEPMPRDVSTKASAEKVLKGLIPGSRAYRFFEEVRNHMSQAIETKLERDVDLFGGPEL
jgi:hypothetical protein